MDKIKPIPGVITHVEDITTPSCRTSIKRDLKTWKADVVLHDGAPNVGISWIQDAFTQSELTLSALRLASEFLVPGGTFVTKIFRSKDYNKLMWVFGQLFSSVEATKPAASRNVSAEIFVVCRDFLAPKKIDPRLLDPKVVFKEMDVAVVEETDIKKIKAAQGAIMNDLFHPEKRKRHRDGYADGDYTLHTATPASSFINSPSFLQILANSNSLVLDGTLADSVFTTDEVREWLGDLKVLGKGEFKGVMKWRDNIRIEMGLRKPKVVEEVIPESVDEDLTIDEIIDRERTALALKQRKLKKKKRERKAKVVIKLRLGMETPVEIGVEQDFGGEEIDMGGVEKKRKAKAIKTSLDVESDDDNVSIVSRRGRNPRSIAHQRAL